VRRCAAQRLLIFLTCAAACPSRPNVLRPADMLRERRHGSGVITPPVKQQRMALEVSNGARGQAGGSAVEGR